MNGLLAITDDLFDIADRLKSVNPNYKLYYNRKTEKYEVHDASQSGSTLAFVVPYDQLDCRTVKYAVMSRVEHAERIFREMEAHNERVEREERRAVTEKILEKMEEAV